MHQPQIPQYVFTYLCYYRALIILFDLKKKLFIRQKKERFIFRYFPFFPLKITCDVNFELSTSALGLPRQNISNETNRSSRSCINFTLLVRSSQHLKSSITVGDVALEITLKLMEFQRWEPLGSQKIWRSDGGRV